MSFLNRLRGTDKAKGSKKGWEPPKLPPPAPEDEFKKDGKESSDWNVARIQALDDMKMKSLNQRLNHPISSFDFISNETEATDTGACAAPNRSLQKSLFSFISELNEPGVEEIDNEESHVVPDKEKTLHNTIPDSRKDSVNSYESGSAFDFISDDQDLEDDGQSTETRSEKIINDDGIVLVSSYFSNENEDAQDKSGETRENEIAEKMVLDVKATVTEEKKLPGDVDIDNGGARTEKQRGAEKPDMPSSRSELGIRNETLEDLEGVIGNDSDDVSYDVQLDEEEKFEVYLETLKSREKSLREALDKLKENRDEVLSDLKETTFSKDYLSTQLEHLQSEQNIAVNQEDFALADKVNQQIEVKQSELRNLKYQHPILDQKVSKFMEDCNAVLKSYLSGCTDLEEEFQGIIATEKESVEKKIAKNEGDIAKAKLKLDEERSRLDRETSHVTLDRKHLEDSRIKLDNKVREITRTQQAEKSALLAEKQSIKADIDELETKLLKLRERESTISSNLEAVDLKIREMTLDFLPQEQSLEKERRDIAEKEQEVAKKMKVLEENEAKLTERIKEDEQSERKWMENIKTLTVKIALLEELRKEMSLNEIHLQEIVDVNLLNFLPSEEHERLTEKVKQLSIQLNNEKYQDVDCSTQITRIRKRLDDIEARVEELEKEKHLAISGRNFKAAKVVTEEKHKIMEEGQKKQEQLKHLEETRAQLKSSMDILSKEISGAEEEALQIETELDKRISVSLTEAITSLRKYHTNSSFDSWIRPFVGFEIDVCQDIIREIYEKHNWEEPDILKCDDVLVGEEVNIESPSTNFKGETEEDSVIRELESQLEMAVESEDFDAAHEINCKIQNYKLKIGSKS